MTQLLSINEKNSRDWPVALLSAVGSWGSGGTPRRGIAGYYGGAIPWLKIGDLNDGVVTESEERITDKGLSESSAKMVPSGGLLVAMYGSIGKLGIAGCPLATNQAIAHCVVNQDRFDTDYLFYYLLSERSNLLNEGKGGTQSNISQTVLKAYPVPEPPLDEQRRIVGVLREALAEARRGREALGQVAGQMKRFRQAVLAQAFRGELTAEWRDAHADRFREAAEAYDALVAQRGGAAPGSEDLPAPLRDWLPADRLREVILADRRARWESAQLVKMAAKGGPKDDKWKARYVEPAVPTEPEESEIQDSWVWVSLESLTTVVTSGSRDWKRHYKVGGPGVFVMAQNIRPMRYDRSYRLEVAPPPGDRDAERSEITHGDLLVTIVGANTGDACMVDFDPVRHYVCQSVALLRPVHPGMAEYVALHLNSPWPTLLQWHDWIYGEGRPHLSFDHLKQTAIALAPLAEQREIVARIEALFAQAEATESTAATALSHLRRLEQSTLRAAFAGQL